jgi:hypothetical protein
LQDLRRLLPFARARPEAVRGAGAPGEVLVLQLGENPTVDYYLRPRLEASGLAWRTADLREDPRACPSLESEAPFSAVFCRYAAGPWLEALEAAGPRLAHAALFVDDDLAAMPFDPALPWAYRGHVLAWHGRWAGRLSRLVDAVWVSTPALAGRYAAAAVLSPIPEADPPPPDPAAPPRIVYPGQALHGRERDFVLAVAGLVAERRPDARFEVVGGTAHAPNVETVAERPWPAWRAAQAGRAAAISLAPLFYSAVNSARAPVKAFDAARVGAVGLYADAEPYRGFIQNGVDGLLLPMRPEAWAEAIVLLLEEPAVGLVLARAMRRRLMALRREPSPLPWVAS